MTARSIGFASAALILLCGSSPSHASSTKETSLQRIQRSVARIDHEASTPEGEERVVSRLSSQLRMSPDSLRARRAAWALSYGETAMVYGFARSAKKPSATLPDQIVEMRRSGMAWDAIAKKIGVNVEAVAARVNKSVPPKPTPVPTPH